MNDTVSNTILNNQSLEHTATGKVTILQVIGGMNRGGSETFLMNVLRNIDRSKFQFIFLCYGNEHFDYEDEILCLGAKIIRIPDVKGVGIRKHIKDLRRVIKENKIDVVHAHTYHNSVFSMFAARLAGVKLRIVHSHNTVAEQNPGLLKKVYFTVSKLGTSYLANHFLACGKEAGEALFLRTKPFTIINNGIDIEKFAYDKHIRQDVRRGLGIDDNTTVIMHVGRFDVQKNHAFLIDVFNEVIKLNTDTKLIMVGDGHLRKSIENMIKSKGFVDKILFLGKRSDMHRLYNAADIFIFPSLYEGLGIVLIEAQANGLKCLVSDTVPDAAKLTDAVKFYPLGKGSVAWASKLVSIDPSRIDCNIALREGPYNMKTGVRSIEKIYASSRGMQ